MNVTSTFSIKSGFVRAVNCIVCEKIKVLSTIVYQDATNLVGRNRIVCMLYRPVVLR